MFLEKQTALNFFPAKFDVISKMFGPFHILDLFNDVDIIATLPVGVLRSPAMPTFRKRDQETTTTYSLQYEKKIFEPLPLVEPLYVSRDISSRVTVETRKRKEVISSGKLKVSDVFQGLVFVLKIVGWFLKINTGKI